MEPRKLQTLLRELGLVQNLERMTWTLELHNRTEISYEMLGRNEKEILVRVLRQQRQSLDRFIADLERRVIEYE